MGITSGVLPPSRENWELLVSLWKWFPVVTLIQHATDWFPQGKTSYASRLNLPGKIGWATMEAPGFLTLLYIIKTLPKENGIKHLPWQNWLLVALFVRFVDCGNLLIVKVIHYLHRAVIAPLFLNPSMSPIHILVWLFALVFQLCNAVCIGGYLSGYGALEYNLTFERKAAIAVGTIIFFAGMFSNWYYDDILRDIRRKAALKESRSKEQGRVYEIPRGGLFELCLYPHYLTEWIEWAGWWAIGGLAFFPGQAFLINEIATMAPSALRGRRWYYKKFGMDQIGNKAAVIPGLL